MEKKFTATLCKGALDQCGAVIEVTDNGQSWAIRAIDPSEEFNNEATAGWKSGRMSNGGIQTPKDQRNFEGNDDLLTHEDAAKHCLNHCINDDYIDSYIMLTPVLSLRQRFIVWLHYWIV